MKGEDKSEEMIVAYLLGGLPAEEREQIEERYFTDPVFLEQINAIEADLLEKYARGRLPNAQAEKVKEYLLTSNYQKQKLHFTETLLNELGVTPDPGVIEDPVKPVKPSPPKRRFQFIYSPVPLGVVMLAAVVILITAGWLVRKVANLERRVASLQQEQAQMSERETELKATIEQQKEQIAQITSTLPGGKQDKEQPAPQNNLKEPLLASNRPYTLEPPKERAGERPKVIPIPSGVENLRIDLIYEGPNYQDYVVTLENLDGDELLSKSATEVKTSGRKKKIGITIPTRLLENRTYNLTLWPTGRERPLQRYTFTAQPQ